MPEMKTLNGYEVVDAKAREEIKSVKEVLDNLDIPETDLSAYATETYVDVAIENAIEKIDIPEVDLSQHALKSEIPNKVSQLENDRKYITLNEVPNTDLSAYALKSELPKVPTKVSAFDNDAGYLTQHQSLSAYAKKTDIPDITTKADKTHTHDSLYDPKGAAQQVKDDLLGGASAAYDTLRELGTLIIDNHDAIEALEIIASGKADRDHTHSQYLTEHQDLSAYAKKSEIPDISTKADKEHTHSQYLTEHQDLSTYAKKSDIPTVPTKVSQLTNDKEYVTKDELPDGVDTSNFLTKTTVNDQYNWYVPTSNKHQIIQNDMPVEKMDTALDRVISGKTLNNNSIAVREGLQLRVPETPTATNHAASKKYVDTKVASISIPDPDLSEYAKKTDIPTVPTKTSQLTNDSNFITSIPSEYVTEAELSAKNYLTEHQSLTAYATKTYVDNTVAENQPNLTTYAKKSDIPDVSGFITSIPAEYVTESELNAKGYLTEHQSLAGKADKNHTHDNYVDTFDFAQYQLDVTNRFQIHSHSQYADKTHNHSMADITDYVAPEIPSIEGLATEKYVDDAIADIDAQSGTELVKLNFSSGAPIVTDEKTIECLNKALALELPLCSYNGNLITSMSKSGNSVYFYYTVDGTSSTHTITYVLRVDYDASSDWWEFYSESQKIHNNYTKTSQLENDSGFITAEALSSLATKTELNTLETDIAEYVEGVESRLTANIPTKVSQLTNDKNYISSTTADSNYYPKSSGQTNAAEIAAIKADYVSQDKLLVMTSSAYSALSTKDSNTFYFIKES